MSNENAVRLNTGQYMPIIGLGTYAGYDDVMRKSLRAALEHGYRSIDTAYLYMNEEAIGEELHDWFTKGKLKREDVFVTSKLPAYGNRPEDVNKYLMLSLKKLKLDYLDLYLIHHPFGFKCLDDLKTIPTAENGDVYLFDTNLEELWKSMEKEVEAGRIKALGLSNFNAQQIERIIKVAKYPPTVHQIEAHATFQQRPMMEFCQKRDIVVVAYRPFGASISMDGGKSSSPLLVNPTVVKIASKHGKNPGQILLKFLVQRNFVVIPMSTSPERIKGNFDIMDFTLTNEDMNALTKLDTKDRIFHFKEIYKGCDNHKEYPFHADF